MKTKDNRGFTTFNTLTCTYGTEVRVKESSAASRPHIWIFMQEDASVLTKPELGAASAHLSIPQARRLVNALQAAIDQHYQLKPRRKSER